MKNHIPFVLLAIADVLMISVFLIDGMSAYLIVAVFWFVLIHFTVLIAFIAAKRREAYLTEV